MLIPDHFYLSFFSNNFSHSYHRQTLIDLSSKMSIRPCDESIFHRPTFGWFVVTFFHIHRFITIIRKKIMPKIHFNNYGLKKKRCPVEWCEWGIASELHLRR